MADEFTPGSAPDEAGVAQTSLHRQLFGREENMLRPADQYKDRNEKALEDTLGKFTLSSRQVGETEHLVKRSREADLREAQGHLGWEPVRASVDAGIENAGAVAEALWQGMCGMTKGSLNVADALADYQTAQTDLAALRKQHAKAVHAIQRGELILERPHEFLDHFYSRSSLAELRRPVFPRDPHTPVEMPPTVNAARPRVEALASAIQKAEKRLAEFKADLAEKIEKEERVNKALATAEANGSNGGRMSDADLKAHYHRTFAR